MPEPTSGDHSKAPRKSRIQRLQESGTEPDMPPIVPAAQYLLGHLFDVGPVVHTGMGVVPVRDEHIEPWERKCGIELRPWEARALRRLSRAYLSELNDAEKPDHPSPWNSEVTTIDRSIAANDMKAAVRKLANL